MAAVGAISWPGEKYFSTTWSRLGLSPMISSDDFSEGEAGRELCKVQVFVGRIQFLKPLRLQDRLNINQESSASDRRNRSSKEVPFRVLESKPFGEFS